MFIRINIFKTGRLAISSFANPIRMKQNNLLIHYTYVAAHIVRTDAAVPGSTRSSTVPLRRIGQPQFTCAGPYRLGRWRCDSTADA